VPKLKDILSANKQVVVKLGELADYVSLQTTIERKEFEDAASGYFSRVALPIEEALKKAGLTLEDIDQVEILGGGVRVPKVQEIL
jgi:molecular chaperone DnaK (HSP70)